MIPDLSVEKIRDAVTTIRSNYQLYADNAIIAAKHFSFDKAVQPYLDFISES
jgi:hypothetical protein